MEFQNVKAACKSGGKKPETSTELDDQAGDDSRKSEHADGDPDDFQPISGSPDFGGRAFDPFIPGSLPLGTRAVVMTQVPVELGMFVRGGTVFHETLADDSFSLGIRTFSQKRVPPEAGGTLDGSGFFSVKTLKWIGAG